MRVVTKRNDSGDHRSGYRNADGGDYRGYYSSGVTEEAEVVYTKETVNNLTWCSGDVGGDGYSDYDFGKMDNVMEEELNQIQLNRMQQSR